jgi:tetratricopeptide (TPR) repeat protein
MLLGNVGFGVQPTRSAFTEARRAAKHSLDLARDADSLAEALTTSAFIALIFDWKFQEAERLFSDALSFNPNYAPAHHWQAHLLLYTMRWPEAIAAIETACRLAPNEPMAFATLGWFLYFMNRIDEAIAVNEEAVRLHPGFGVGYEMLGFAYEAGERYEDAIAAFENSFTIDPRPPPLAGAAHAYAVWGKKGKARLAVKRLLSFKKSGLVSPYFMSLVNAGLGNVGEAMGLLLQAHKERCGWLIQLGVDPRWKPLHGTAEFGKLMRSIGLPPI